MRVPLYEVVPVDLVMGHCTVLDLNTYCKGRPIGSSPQHTYICEYRVDKNARIFAKIPKPKSSNICTKSYAFEAYDVRLKPQRNYAVRIFLIFQMYFSFFNSVLIVMFFPASWNGKRCKDAESCTCSERCQ